MRTAVLAVAALVIGLAPGVARADGDIEFSPWLSDNEGGRKCLTGAASDGTARIANGCDTPISIAFCVSASCGNWETVATVPARGVYNFNGASASLKGCVAGTRAVLREGKDRAICVPLADMLYSRPQQDECVEVWAAPDRRYTMKNTCSTPRWVAYCTADEDGECTVYDRKTELRPGIPSFLTLYPAYYAFTECDEGYVPDLANRPTQATLECVAA